MTKRLGLPALILIAAMLLSSAALAGDGKAGSTYLDVFAIGVGAGPSAMGAYAGAPGDIWSLTYNPAGLANIDRVKLGVSQIEWLEDSSYSYLGVGMPRGDGGLAMGLAYFDLGSVSMVDPQGTELNESAGAYNFGFVGGYGFDFPNVCGLKAGVSGHVIQANLDDTGATAIGLNLGLLYGMMDEQVHVGLVVKNMGTKFKFEDDEDSQTLTYVGGLSYTTLEEQIPNVDLTVGVDAIMPKDQDVGIGVGGEFWVYDMLALRVGYQTGSEMGNLSYGAGFAYSD
ncbi:PorV/PorQ family protein, partial [bacterium]|nr:PorV/PorQ family protein [bacterium]